MNSSKFPPWTIIVLLLMWLACVYFFVVDGIAWHNVFHFLMAALSIFAVIALFKRWRVGFWLSSLVYASATGGNVARIIANETFPVLVVMGTVIGISLVVVHQLLPSLQWFGFQDLRRVRTWFWCLSAFTCIVTEYAFRIFLPSAR